MIVLTVLLSEHQVERVAAATPAPHRVVHASSMTEARAVLRGQPADVLVLDPAPGSHARRGSLLATEWIALGAEHPHIPVVFYVSNAAAPLHVIAKFPTRECCEALVVGLDDDPPSIGQALESVVGASLAATLARRLGSAIAGPRPSLADAIRVVFSQPGYFRTVHDIAKAACMSRRTLDRWLDKHGIVTAAELLEVARVFAAVRRHRNLLPGGEDWRAKHGPEGSAMLASFTGRTTQSAYHHLIELGDAELVERFYARLQRQPVGESWAPARFEGAASEAHLGARGPHPDTASETAGQETLGRDIAPAEAGRAS